MLDDLGIILFAEPGVVVNAQVAMQAMLDGFACSNGRREFTRLMFTYVGGGRGATLKSPFYTGRGCP